MSEPLQSGTAQLGVRVKDGSGMLDWIVWEV